MAETGMANKFYSYKASYPKSYGISGAAKYNIANDDSGVFVLVGKVSNAGFGPLDHRISASNGFVGGTTSNYGSYGGINMCTINDPHKYWTFGVGISSAGGSRLCLNLWRGITIPNANANNGTIKATSSFEYAPSLRLSVSVYKTEVAYRPPKTVSTEYVYATGLSAIAFAEDGSIKGHETMILARAAPTDGTGYPTLGNVSGMTGTYCTDASVVFSDAGKVLGILESNDAAAVTSTNISTSFPEEALSANDGIIAVSCMAGVDGKARWMGYKNGIYKLYHGTKPLYGMPGESVTIKGHEFRCLAYSPFYARMS